MKLQNDYETITGLGAEILAISPDDLSDAGWAVEQLELEFPVLYDPEAESIKEYGIYIPSTGLPSPSTFVLDKTGRDSVELHRQARGGPAVDPKDHRGIRKAQLSVMGRILVRRGFDGGLAGRWLFQWGFLVRDNWPYCHMDSGADCN